MKQRLQKIHEISMTILETVGIRLHHPEIIAILKENSIQVKGDVADFTRDQLYI